MKNLSRFELDENGDIIYSSENLSKMNFIEFVKFISSNLSFTKGALQVLSELKDCTLEFSTSFIALLLKVFELLCQTLFYPVAMPITLFLAWRVNKKNYNSDKNKNKTGTIS